MAKKSKEQKQREIEEEILKEVKEESKEDKKKGKVLEKIKKDISKKPEKTEAPKEEKPKAKGIKPRKEGSKKAMPKTIGDAVETLKGVRKGKAEEEKPKLVGPEKVYTVKIPKSGARRGRTRRAAHNLRDFARKHSKKSDIVISNEVNQAMWKRGSKKHPNKLRITMQEDEEGRVFVNLK